MSALPAVLALGFGLGLRHAADSDHVAAVAALVSRQRRFGSAWLLGTAWGLGHSATLFAVGAAIVLFKVAIPPRLGLAMEFSVGVVLVALGALNLAGRGPLRTAAHAHAHDHDDPAHAHAHGSEHEASGPHVHLHVHDGALARLRARAREAGPGALLRSLGVGLVHGLAGSAAAALLVLAAIPQPRAAALYLAVFAAGTLAGMLALSALMEFSLLAMGRAWAAAGRLAPAAAGLLSVGFGLWVIWRTGFVDGLFLADPRWIPR
jgi:high-affinity nickel-transport protein